MRLFRRARALKLLCLTICVGLACECELNQIRLYQRFEGCIDTHLNRWTSVVQLELRQSREPQLFELSKEADISLIFHDPRAPRVEIDQALAEFCEQASLQSCPRSRRHDDEQAVRAVNRFLAVSGFVAVLDASVADDARVGRGDKMFLDSVRRRERPAIVQPLLLAGRIGNSESDSSTRARMAGQSSSAGVRRSISLMALSP
jgi:hypothetical protein